MKKRLALYATVLALCCAIAALAAISRDFSQGQTTAASGAMTHTFTNAAPANSNRLLIAVFVNNSQGSDTASMDFNGAESLTMNASASSYPATFVQAETWYITDPTATTADIVATTNNNDVSAMWAVALSGVDTSSPFRDSMEESSAAGSATSSSSLTLTTQSGDFVLDCINVRNESSMDPGALTPASGTEFDEQFYNAFNLRGSCTYLTASGTSTSAGAWSWTNGSSYAHVAVAITPLAAPASSHIGIFNLMGIGKK